MHAIKFMVTITPRRDELVVATRGVGRNKEKDKMGLEFRLICIPLAKIDNQRLTVLRDIAGRLTIDDCLDDDRWADDFDEWVKAVKAAVELLPVVEDEHWSEVNHLTVFEEQPYDVLFTGGMVWGGQRSEVFSHFEAILSAKSVLDTLVEWAKADKVAASKRLGG